MTTISKIMRVDYHLRSSILLYFDANLKLVGYAVSRQHRTCKPDQDFFDVMLFITDDVRFPDYAGHETVYSK